MNIRVDAITSERQTRSPRRNLMQVNSLAGSARVTSRRSPLVGAVSALAGLVLVGMLPSTARAEGTPNTIWACYTPSGSVYVINPGPGDLGRSFPGAPNDCASKAHIKFHWEDGAGVG